MTITNDPMLKRSADSEAMVPYWDKVDAILDGIEALRAGEALYMPRFTDETDPEYKFRLKCTKVTNVYRDIVEGLASKPFEQSVQFVDDQSDKQAGTTPQQVLDFSYDVDGSGNNLTVFAANTFFNGINSAIDWIMVDYDKPDPNVRTLADAQRAGLRPYWSHILGRNILDVRSAMIGGEEVLTYVKIFEPGSPDRVREIERSNEGVVTWRLYERTDKMRPMGGITGAADTYFAQIDSGTISIGQIPLVPFVTGRRDGRSWKFFPAMQDAADLQIELYQQESAHKFIKTMAAYPMLAANGITPPRGQDGKPDYKAVKVGPTRVLWGSTDTETGRAGTWQWIQPDANILRYLSDDITATIQNLRELGRQPLTASSSNITVITAAVAAGKAKSAVKAWAYQLKDALENALVLTAKFMGVTYDPSIHVFTDFDDWMEGEDIDAILNMNERGKLSDETTYEELTRRGVLSTNFTVKRERARLLEQLPGDDGPDVTED